MKKVLFVLCLAVLIPIAIPDICVAHGVGNSHKGAVMRVPAHRMPPHPHHHRYHHPSPIFGGISLVFSGYTPQHYDNYYPIEYYPAAYTYPVPVHYSYPANYIRVNFR